MLTYLQALEIDRACINAEIARTCITSSRMGPLLWRIAQLELAIDEYVIANWDEVVS